MINPRNEQDSIIGVQSGRDIKSQHTGFHTQDFLCDISFLFKAWMARGRQTDGQTDKIDNRVRESL